jgi:hypothetical protein
LNRTVLNQKKASHETGRGNSGYHENALHNSGRWQTQHIETDKAEGAITTSAQLFGGTGKSDTTRVFHGIYATTTIS